VYWPTSPCNFVRVGHFCLIKFSGRRYSLVTWLIFGSRASPRGYPGGIRPIRHFAGIWLAGHTMEVTYLTLVCGLHVVLHDYRPHFPVGNEATTKNLSMVGRSLGQNSYPAVSKRNINIGSCVCLCVCVCVCACVLLCRKHLYSCNFLC
jgi:hypothetical protein